MCQFFLFLLLFLHISYRFYLMVQVLIENSILLLYDTVPCISFSNKLNVLVTCRV